MATETTQEARNGPALACPGCGSPDVDLRRGLFCGPCAAAIKPLGGPRSFRMHTTSRVKFGKKAAVWSHHGAHAKIDPRLLRREWVARRGTVWYASIRECFRAAHRI